MNDVLYLCADYVQLSILGDKLIPILRKLKIKKDPNNLQVSLVNQEAKEMLWLPTERSHIDEFWVYITDSKGEIPTLEIATVHYSFPIFKRFDSTWSMLGNGQNTFKAWLTKLFPRKICTL